MNFSTFSEKELVNLDIRIQDLIFNDDAIDQLILSTAEESALELVMRLRDIYAHVNMDISSKGIVVHSLTYVSSLRQVLGCFLTWCCCQSQMFVLDDLEILMPLRYFLR